MCLSDSEFTVLLHSDHALSHDKVVDARKGVYVFNIGSVYDLAPALQRFADAPYAFIKVNYFSSSKRDYATGTANSPNSYTSLLLHLNTNLPNSIQSRNLAQGYHNVMTSDVIGIVPLNLPAPGSNQVAVLSDSFSNSMVKCSNPFKGNVRIQLTYDNGDTVVQTGSETVGALTVEQAKPWLMSLTITFADDPNLYGNVAQDPALPR